MEKKLRSLSEILNSEEFVTEFKTNTKITKKRLWKTSKENKVELIDAYELAQLLSRDSVFKNVRFYTKTRQYLMYFSLAGYYIELTTNELCVAIKFCLQELNETEDEVKLYFRQDYLHGVAKELAAIRGIVNPEKPVVDQNRIAFLNGVLTITEEKIEFEENFSPKYFITGKNPFCYIGFPENENLKNAPIQFIRTNKKNLLIKIRLQLILELYEKN